MPSKSITKLKKIDFLTHFVHKSPHYKFTISCITSFLHTCCFLASKSILYIKNLVTFTSDDRRFNLLISFFNLFASIFLFIFMIDLITICFFHTHFHKRGRLEILYLVIHDVGTFFIFYDVIPRKFISAEKNT